MAYGTLPNDQPLEFDGRRRRVVASRSKILAACRNLMLAGNYRPTMEQCCREAGRSVRCGFEHFRKVENLHGEALKMEGVAESIGLAVISQPVEGIARAVVLGRVA